MTAVQSLEKSGGPAANQWKPYPAYKPSGVEWLGDVPEGWDALPMKRRFHVVNGGTPSSSEESYWEDGAIAWFTPEDLGRNHTKVITSSRRQITREGLLNCGASLTPRHSVLVSTRAPIGHVAISDVESCCNQGCRYFVKARDGLNPDFFYYAIVASKAVLQAAGKGTTFLELSGGMLGMHQTPMPPPAEQRAIADFLDRETGKIDRLVAKKRELIEKLKEERAALISRAVTRGLNPDAQLKPSGVEWLGDVPEGWEVKRLKRILAQPLQYGANESAEIDDPTLPRFVRITDVHEDGTLRDDTFRSLPIHVAEPYLLEDGDLLFARSGATSGKTFLYRESWGVCAYAGYLIRARIDQHKAVPSFVKYFTLSVNYWQWLSAIYIQATIQNVSAEKYADLQVPIPPLPEQRAIADFLDRETGKIDRLAAKVDEAIGRLQEYRAALITAAVTGKIDVRSEASGAALEYPAAQSTWLKAAEKGAPYGAKNAGKKNTDGHGHRRTGQQQVRVRVRPCSHGKTT